MPTGDASRIPLNTIRKPSRRLSRTKISLLLRRQSLQTQHFLELGAVWRNFLGFFKDPHLYRNKDNSSDAYKLLASYRPISNHDFERFRTERQKIYLAGMRITAGLTLGLMAWDAGDRPTAVKRYREAIDLETRDNLSILLTNDETNARILAEEFGIPGAGEHRKEVLGIGQIRREGGGRVTFVKNVQVASDKCGACGKRDAKLMKCSACKTVTYCNVACQKVDWQKHKPICKTLRA
ncbi:hypothetical protein Moror_4761 [Moniliophthora roreri MCA 2997]|uniref:MYND-type domain-containing protein n=1 Tax=Moniliophthora roreri (strain MCA 2997) TaxID=1381753 RepID=V2YKL6_MONRO|nr:hypothetical protein Moror_4761 [Moniliophthora roreri MCA 2997]